MREFIDDLKDIALHSEHSTTVLAELATERLNVAFTPSQVEELLEEADVFQCEQCGYWVEGDSLDESNFCGPCHDEFSPDDEEDEDDEVDGADW